jgi:hypothetical protein
VLNQGFGIAEADCADNQFEPIHEGHAGFNAPLELKPNEPRCLIWRCASSYWGNDLRPG